MNIKMSSLNSPPARLIPKLIRQDGIYRLIQYDDYDITLEPDENKPTLFKFLFNKINCFKRCFSKEIE